MVRRRALQQCCSALLQADQSLTLKRMASSEGLCSWRGTLAMCKRRLRYCDRHHTAAAEYATT